MKTGKTTLLAIAALIVASCSPSKKSTNTTASSKPAPVTKTGTATTAVSSPLLKKPANGVYAPGNEELIAIQEQFKEVTLDKLKEGHSIYSEGACLKCHGAANIYQFDESKWKNIIDRMAPKAYLNESQKDAVYKYVLAIKAAKAKEAR